MVIVSGDWYDPRPIEDDPLAGVSFDIIGRGRNRCWGAPRTCAKQGTAMRPDMAISRVYDSVRFTGGFTWNLSDCQR